MSGLRLPRFRLPAVVLEEIAEVVAIELHSSDRSVELRSGVANHVVGGIACESDEQSLARQLHVEPRTAQPTCKRIRVVIEFKAEEPRAFREFRDGAGVLEFAELDGDEEIADAFDFAEEVRGDDDGDAELSAGAFDEAEHFLAAFGVEAVGGLVEEEEFGIVDERLRELDALLHAGGVAADEAVALLVEADVTERLGGAFARGGGGEAGHAAHVGHEVGGGHIYRKAVVLGEVADELADLERVGERVHAQNFEGTGGGGEEAEEDADEGGFAGAVGADEADDAGVERERERIEGGYARVALGDAAGAEEGHGPEVWGEALETTELGRGWFRRRRRRLTADVSVDPSMLKWRNCASTMAARDGSLYLILRRVPV